MNKYVTDTQALVKFLSGKKVINDKIHSIFEDTDNGKAIIVIPSIVLFEIAYLHEKKRIPISLSDIEAILSNSINYTEKKLSINMIKSAFEIDDIPELHDRLIAGTALYLNIPILTNDSEIQRSKYVETI